MPKQFQQRNCGVWETMDLVAWMFASLLVGAGVERLLVQKRDDGKLKFDLWRSRLKERRKFLRL